jgi:arginase family enzyme
LNKLHDSGQLVSMDLVEYNPLMDIIKEDYTGDVI